MKHSKSNRKFSLLLFLFLSIKLVDAQPVHYSIGSGYFSWYQGFMGSTYSKPLDLDFACDENGGIFLSTNTVGYISTYHIDSLGILKWSKNLWNFPPPIDYISTNTDTIINRSSRMLWVNRMTNNSYAFIGVVDSVIRINHVNDFFSSILITKIDTGGNLIWSKSLGFDSFSSIKDYKTSLISGNSWVIIGNSIAKLDNSANVVWSKYYFDSLLLAPNQIMPLDDDGALIIGRYSNYSTFVLRIDENGNIIWNKIYSTITTQGGSALITFENKDFLFMNINFNRTPVFLFVRCDSTGNIKYSKAMDNAMYSNASVDDIYNNAYGIRALSNDSILIFTNKYYLLMDSTLSFIGKVESGNLLVISADLQYSVVSNFEISNGKLIDSKISTSYDGHFGTAGGHYDYRYLSSIGEFCSFSTPYSYNVPYNFSDTSTIFLDSTASWVTKEYFLTDSTSYFVLTIDTCELDIVESHLLNIRINAYPNPNSGKFNLDFYNVFYPELSLKIYDYTGRVILQMRIDPGEEKIPIDISRYGHGLFLMELFGNEHIATMKIIVD